MLNVPTLLECFREIALVSYIFTSKRMLIQTPAIVPKAMQAFPQSRDGMHRTVNYSILSCEEISDVFGYVASPLPLT